MILDEYFGHQKLLWDTKILATDVSDEVLKTAIKGIYSNDKIKPLPSKWRNEYFMNYNNTNSVLINKIRNDVIYRRFNLKDEYYPFKQKFHVIFCRNVMIYFDETTKNEIVKKFYNLLHKGGYLFIGHSETINKECANFQYIMPAVYRKD
jgi:chemotaxis protein methyltransferase CheR